MSFLLDEVTESSDINATRNEVIANTQDAVWTLAKAIDACLTDGISMTLYSKPDESGFVVFQEGDRFRDRLRNVSFTGVSGYIQMQRDGSREPRYNKNYCSVKLCML